MTTSEPTVADAALDNLNDAMAVAERVVKEAFTGLRSAIVAERVAPHPAQSRADDLEKLLRMVIGRIHAQATSANNKGAFVIGADLRKLAQQTSAAKAELLGDAPAHEIDVTTECGLIVVACVCGWFARSTSFDDEAAAHRYGAMHLEQAGVATNGSRKKKS